MNLSDLAQAPSRTAARTARQLAFAAAQADTPVAADLDPQALLAQVGGEVARTLSSALERVSTLIATGQIDRDGLRALREEIDAARRASIMGQQWARLSDSNLQPAHQHVDLTALLREALTQRHRETQARGLEIKQALAEVALESDAALVFSLIETMLDWTLEHARSRAVFRLESKSLPARARLTCAFLRRHPNPARRHGPDPIHIGGQPDLEDPALNTVAWRLLQQTAAVLGLGLKRRDTGERCELRLHFPSTVAAVAAATTVATAAVTAVAPVEKTKVKAALPAPPPDEDAGVQMPFSATLAGRHIVVLSAQREVRNIVRDALRPTGSMVDFVTTLDEAQRLFDEALPHAVVYEASLAGSRFSGLRNSLLLETPTLAFVQITPDSRAFEVLEFDGYPYASVGLDGLLESLPAALLFELSRHG